MAPSMMINVSRNGIFCNEKPKEILPANHAGVIKF